MDIIVVGRELTDYSQTCHCVLIDTYVDQSGVKICHKRLCVTNCFPSSLNTKLESVSCEIWNPKAQDRPEEKCLNLNKHIHCRLIGSFIEY